MQSSGDKREYWKKNLIYVGALLAIWFLVSFGFGILLVEPLNRVRIGGFKRFWFAQQGSMYVFDPVHGHGEPGT